MGLTILETQIDELFESVDIVVQDALFIEDDADDPFTSIRFFALGATDEIQDESQAVLALNGLIVDAFDQDSQQEFLDLLDDDPVLSSATQVDVQPFNEEDDDAPQGPKTAESSRLSPLDIVLIVMCVLIILGIAYMIFEHHRDRGMIENERLQVVNQSPSAGDELTANGNIGVLDVSPSHDFEIVGKVKSDDFEDDGTPSTPSTTDSIAEEEQAPKTPERNVCITTTTISAQDPDVLLLTESSTDGTGLAENFENRWFHPAKTTPRFRYSMTPVSVIEEEEEDGVFEDKSETSDDVFRVARSQASAANDTNISLASANSEVSEWMKTIQVVPSMPDGPTASEDLSQSVMTIEENMKGEEEEDEPKEASRPSTPAVADASVFSSDSSCESGFSSSDSSETVTVDNIQQMPSMEDDGSLDAKSLEHSLASSCPGQVVTRIKKKDSNKSV